MFSAYQCDQYGSIDDSPFSLQRTKRRSAAKCFTSVTAFVNILHSLKREQISGYSSGIKWQTKWRLETITHLFLREDPSSGRCLTSSLINGKICRGNNDLLLKATQKRSRMKVLTFNLQNLRIARLERHTSHMQCKMGHKPSLRLCLGCEEQQGRVKITENRW